MARGDPRRASLNLAQRDSRIVLLDHSYSKRYREGCESHPRFFRIPPCSRLNSELLTELKSSTARGKGSRRGSISGGPRLISGADLAKTKNTADEKPDDLRKEESKKALNQSLSPVPAALAVSGSDSSSSVKSASYGRVSDNTRPSKSQVSHENPNTHSQTPSRSPSKQPKIDHHFSHTKTPTKAHRTPDPRAQSSVEPSSSTGTDTLKSRGAREELSSLERDQLGFSDDFQLDLDLEPTGGSTSGSNCCSETEDLTESRTEDSDMEVEGDSTTEDGDLTLVGGARSSEDELGSLPGTPRKSEVDGRSLEKWAVSSPEPGKMRFSRVDSSDGSPEGERLALKQMTSNRIQLRNGRVLPVSSLAYLTQVTTSPSGSSSVPLTSPSLSSPSLSSSPSNPEIGRLRRSKRLAGSCDPFAHPPLGLTDSDSTADLSFETHLSDASSDGSDFEMPDFCPKPSVTESPGYRSAGEGRGGWGRRGRGRGRWGKRGVRRGGGGRGTTRIDGEKKKFFSVLILR